MKHFSELYCMLIFFVCFVTPAEAKGLKVTRPDAFGIVFIATRQDAAQIGGCGAGPGFGIFLKYRSSTRLFMKIGTGISTVTDDYMRMQNFKTILFPSVELKIGSHGFKAGKFNPFIYTGLHFFASMDREKTPSGIDMGERYFHLGGLIGAGFEYRLVYPWSFYFSSDYRYVFTESSGTNRRYLVIQGGLCIYI